MFKYVFCKYLNYNLEMVYFGRKKRIKDFIIGCGKLVGLSESFGVVMFFVLNLVGEKFILYFGIRKSKFFV